MTQSKGASLAGPGYSSKTEPKVSALRASIPSADLAELIYQSVRFSFWAGGQGICPVAGEDAGEPEEFFYRYSLATGDEEWETLADRLAIAMEARSGETGTGSTRKGDSAAIAQ